MAFETSRNFHPPKRRAMRGRYCARTMLFALASAVLGAGEAGAGLNVWTSSGPFGAGVTAVATAPSGGGTTYAATAGKGVFKSTDGGAAWSPLDLGDIYVEQVAVHPIFSDVVYATSPNHGVFESRDGGESWGAINAGLQTPAAHHLAIDPLSATLYVSSDDGVYVSHDLGAHWRPTALRTKGPHGAGDDLGLFAWIDCLAFEPATGALYACYFSWSTAGPGWQLLRSGDAGGSWQPVPLPSDGGPVAIAIDASQGGALYVATYEPYTFASRVLHSVDGGASWQVVGGELPDCERGCRVHGLAVGGGAVYAAGERGVLASADGAAWTPLGQGMDDRVAFGIAVETAGAPLAHAATDDGVFSIVRAAPCAGDCDADGAVGIADLVTLVDIAIGRRAATACAAGDAGGDGRIAVDDLVAAVGHAMQGCSAPSSL